jgi:putative flippase GtrA
MNHISSATRYALLGAANTLLYSVLLYAFLEYLPLSSGASVTLSYLIAIPFHFTMNRIYVFEATAVRITAHIVRYLVLVAISFLVSLALVSFCRDSLQMHPFTVVAVNAVAIAALGYTLSAFWVFR